MLLFRLISIVLVAGVQFVSAAEDESVGDPDTTLKLYVGSPAVADGAVDETKAIRGLLMKRQSGCSVGYGVCSDGGCCPLR